ncbi:hypothetical protein E0486_17195, partial [Flaviaesturariibacter aridisoli]
LTAHASRLTPHASRLTPHASRLTAHASRPWPENLVGFPDDCMPGYRTLHVPCTRRCARVAECSTFA